MVNFTSFAGTHGLSRNFKRSRIFLPSPLPTEYGDDNAIILSYFTEMLEWRLWFILNPWNKLHKAFSSISFSCYKAAFQTYQSQEETGEENQKNTVKKKSIQNFTVSFLEMKQLFFISKISQTTSADNIFETGVEMRGWKIEREENGG